MIDHILTFLNSDRCWEIIGAIIATVVIAFGKKIGEIPKRIKPILFCETFSSSIPYGNVPMVSEIKSMETSNEDNISFYKGSLIKSIIRNRYSSGIAISKMWLIVDEVRKIEHQELQVLGHGYAGKFAIYVVNNGDEIINNVAISLKAKIEKNSENYEFYEISDEDFSSILKCSTDELNFKISSIKSGEILRLANFTIDLDILYKEENWSRVCVTKIISFDNMRMEAHDPFLVNIFRNDRNGERGYDIAYTQGGVWENEKYLLSINPESSYPMQMELPVEFGIDANKDMLIQIFLYAKSSCLIQYHFKLIPAGKRAINSKKQKVKLFVPVYCTDGGLFTRLRKWVNENQIAHYFFNEQPVIQKEIVYMVPKSLEEKEM